MSLQFDRIDKSFGAITALRQVSFDVAEGEAHAIVGENGAGKSTLLKILAGLVRADAGTITWQGRRFAPANPREAIEHGIGMVYQEMLCLPTLSVTANIFCGREICRYGVLDESAMREHTQSILRRLSLAIDPDAPAESLSAAHRQLLQVARALAFDCRVLVLDEPTTSLTDAEADHLFDVVRELRRGGTTILYVSHRLPEVFRLCDRITVLRDGSFIATRATGEVTPADIVRMMVGREILARYRGTEKERRHGGGTEDALLSTTRLSRAKHFNDVTIDVRAGEVVGLFGLVGSGRSELLETIFGVHRPTSGAITVDGKAITFRSPRDAARAGIVLVPEERHRQGLWFNFDLCNNLSIPKSTMAARWLIDADTERADATSQLAAWRIKAANIEVALDTLSGGNQQKVVVAKWVATGPRVLLLDEPTKGVDVGAKFEIHELIRAQAARGIAVLVVSSDLPEILSLCDRILVMREGALQGELDAHVATEEDVMRLATHPVPHQHEPGTAAAGGRA